MTEPTMEAAPPRRSGWRRWRAGVIGGTAVAVLAGAGAIVGLPAASAATVDTNAWYVLVNRNSGKAMDVANTATTDGAQIQQWVRNDGAWQQWQFVDSGGGWYRLRSKNSNKVLDVADFSKADGAKVQQWPDLNGVNQQFKLTDSDGGHVRLINRNSGKALDVAGASAADGAKVQQWADGNRANQQWQLVKLGAGAGKTFTNPIKRNAPDPWLTYYNGNYHMAATTWNSKITMRKSKTLAGLNAAPEVTVFNLEGRANGCCNMWAPEFHLLDGPNGKRWYLYYVAGQNVADFNPTQRLHVLESVGTDPMGPYNFKADLGNTWQLDASILKLNNKLYLMGTYIDGTQNLFIQELSNPWTTVGARRRLTAPTLPWERQGGNVAEGPEALQYNGKTFIIYSASACWGPDYKLGMLTYVSGDPLLESSWKKAPNPVFQRNDANGVFAPGHNGFFTSPDGKEHWIVYHANESAGGGCDMNRSARAQKFTWNADGTPNLGTPVPLGVTLAAPSGE